jgi:NSS family neurotransmitter:Na+ symporter
VTRPREFFGSRVGFVLAAAGSAIGLGNIWRFPYQAAEGGGAAFVVVYLFMTMLIGIPMMAAEFIVGRRTRLSPIGAIRTVGGRAWVPLGFLFAITPLLILGYFSVIAGWTFRYAIDAMIGFSTSPAERYAEVATGLPAIQNHLIMMAVTIGVVMAGVHKGIERVAVLLMPTLAILLVGLAVWAMTLPGSGPGYAFYLRPSIENLLDPNVVKQAASQAFLSLSVGMGIMITLVVFPVIFALGLSDEVRTATMGALFISLPGAFVEMGILGQVVGFLFFLALVVAGLTSAFSLLEVGVASLMDEYGLSRKAAALIAGVVPAGLGVVPALSQNALGVLDKVASELFVVAGVFGMSLLVGWAMKDPLSELREGASPFLRRVAPGAIFTIRYIVPPAIAVIGWFVLKDTIAVLFG